MSALFWAPHVIALCLVSTWKEGVALIADTEHGKGTGTPAWTFCSDLLETWLPEGLLCGLQYMTALYLQLWFSQQPVPLVGIP